MDDDDEDYEDFDHLADPEELERRAAFRRASYKVMTEGTKNNGEDNEDEEEEEEDDDDFGDFESATGNIDKEEELLTNGMNALNVNNKSSPPMSSPPQDDSNLVRAIKTKEEEEYLKQKKDYQHDEEQEGEV